jgi:hypothetical protein
MGVQSVAEDLPPPPPDDPEETPPEPRRRRRQQFWDDEAFRQRVAELAKRRGVTVREAMLGAGLAVDYTYKAQDSRGINQLMAIAKYFEVPTEEVLGLKNRPPEPLELGAASTPALDPRMISEAALMTVLRHADRWLFLALTLNRPDADLDKVAAALRMDMEDFREETT